MQDTIQDVTNTGFISQSVAFSIATLMYARIRRVAGRMIDVMYLVENKAYAGYIIQHAALLQDEELDRLINRLQALILKESQIEIHDEDDSVQNKENLETFSESTGQSEVTNEEYQAQVSHHYIGALR